MQTLAFRPVELQESAMASWTGWIVFETCNSEAPGAKALAEFILARNRRHCEHWLREKPMSKEATESWTSIRAYVERARRLRRFGEG